jgi:cytoskeleton protein RodZ
MMVDSPDVLVRRRSSLLVVLLAASTGLTAGYIWRFSASSRPLDLVVGLVLAVIALCHAYAWVDSRTPLLVADSTGVRIRLGRDWTGIPWDRVESVEVEARGRVKDGRVAVLAADSGSLLAKASRRSRWAAALNRRLYGAALVAPYGLATTESVTDIAGAMELLARGRAPVVVCGTRAGSDSMEQESSAVVAVSADGDVVHAGDFDGDAGGYDAGDAPPADEAAVVRADEAAVVRADVAAVVRADEESALTAPRPVDEKEGAAPAVPSPAEEGPDARPARSPRRKVWAARGSRSPAGPSPVVTIPRTARREERTLDPRPAAASFGALALSEPTSAAAAQLPEIEELRRPVEEEPVIPEQATGDSDLVSGNVSLIIDATTDLSARAMQRVREFQPTIPAQSTPATADQAAQTSAGTVIGAELAHARETLGLSVDELADRTRIRPSVIESIERDDFSPCGGDFYAKGHLRMLCRVLGVEAAPLLSAYDAGFATSPIRARDVFEAELSTGSSGLVRGGASGTNWGVLVAVVLVLLVVWGAARVFSGSGDPSPATVAATGSRGAGSPKAVSPPVVPPQTHVEVTVSGGDSRVVVRDQRMHVLFSQVLTNGTVRHFHGSGPLRIHAADAGVVSLSVYGRNLGVLGPAGSPAYRIIPGPHAHAR